MPPRTLQRFLGSIQGEEQRLRDRVQRMVARDHADPQAIGVLDESGNPKKGWCTAAVQRQWCGNTGKVDNGVVAVHLGYVVDDFQCLPDSALFLPESWANDPVRRAAAFVPEEVKYFVSNWCPGSGGLNSVAESAMIIAYEPPQRLGGVSWGGECGSFRTCRRVGA